MSGWVGSYPLLRHQVLFVFYSIFDSSTFWECRDELVLIPFSTVRCCLFLIDSLPIWECRNEFVLVPFSIRFFLCFIRLFESSLGWECPFFYPLLCHEVLFVCYDIRRIDSLPVWECMGRGYVCPYRLFRQQELFCCVDLLIVCQFGTVGVRWSLSHLLPSDVFFIQLIYRFAVRECRDEFVLIPFNWWIVCRFGNVWMYLSSSLSMPSVTFWVLLDWLKVRQFWECLGVPCTYLRIFTGNLDPHPDPHKM